MKRITSQIIVIPVKAGIYNVGFLDSGFHRSDVIS